MTIPVTLLYGSLTALLLGLLGVNVSRMRVAKRAYVGAAPDPELQRAIRAHGNAAEWVPMLILLLLLLELIGASGMVLHVLGGTILASRLGHAIGLLAKLRIGALAATVTFLLAVGMPIYVLVLRFH